MAIVCKAEGFLAYNPSDLIPDGYIWPILNKEHAVGGVSQGDLESPDEGVSFTYERDADGNVTAIIEKRKQLPCSSINIECIFGKQMTNQGGTLVEPGTFFGTPAASMVGGALLTGVMTGAPSKGTSNFIFHICATETRINVPVKITEEILQTGIFELPYYPLSVLAVVKEFVDPNDEEDTVPHGLKFTDAQLSKLGLSENRRQYFKIKGVTDYKGHFGGTFGLADGQPPQYGTPDAANSISPDLFLEIIRDNRKLKFRGDNPEGGVISGLPISSTTQNDITDKKIKINTDGLTEEDLGKKLYITMCLGRDRYIRYIVSHRGTAINAGSMGGSGTAGIYSIGFVVDAWNYQLCQWMVPKGSPSFNANNSEFKVPYSAFPVPVTGATLEYRLGESDSYEVIEGWRLSEGITYKTSKMWAADRRGIVLVTIEYGQVQHATSTVIFPREQIRDQIWFDNYLQENNLEDKDISLFSVQDVTGVLYDISDINNTLLYDREKTPYYRPFALALKNISKYSADDNQSGVGIVNLDIVNNNLQVDSNFYDLSNVLFKSTPMSSYLATDSTAREMGYSGFGCSFIDDRGSYFAGSNPSNQTTFSLYVPSGFIIESDWRLFTPEFYGKFSKKTRIYVEEFSGDVPCQLSNLFVKTKPIVEGAISVDHNYFRDAILVFEDNILNECLSFHYFPRSSYKEIRNRLTYDGNLSHQRLPFDHNKFLGVGYDRLIGTIPSYSEGRPASIDYLYACNSSLSGTSYDEIYTKKILVDEDQVNYITTNKISVDIDEIDLIRVLKITYFCNDIASLSEDQKSISLQFTSTDTVINNIYMPFSSMYTSSFPNLLIIDCRFYRGGPIVLEGEILEHITIQKIEAITIEQDTFFKYKVDGKQPSMIYSRSNEIAVLYSDKMNNLSITISYDNGLSWFNYQGIIRLAKGETVSLPYIVHDDVMGFIHLFYVLNNKFLMYRQVNLNDLVCEDSFLVYNPPDLIGSNTSDDLIQGTNLNGTLQDYTDRGKQLRTQPSYFVCGDAEDTFFLQEIEISKERKEAELSQRFVYMGSGTQMDKPFEESRYAVYKDKHGRVKLYFSTDGKLNIKISSNFLTWSYAGRDIIFHRNFFPQGGSISQVELSDSGIDNIQTIYDEYTDTVSIVYFHDEMMFLRKFPNHLIVANYGNNQLNSESIISLMGIDTENFNNLPLFLSGRLSEEIQSAYTIVRGKIDSGTATEDAYLESNLSVIVPYYVNELSGFSGLLDVDTEVQPFGFITETGSIRLFYMDSDGVVQGMLIMAGKYPNLDVKLVNKI